MSHPCRKASLALATLTLIGAAGAAQAGVYSDDLGKCLVSSTSVEDRNAMIRWMFAAVASNPAVKDLVAVSPEQIDKANAAMGGLMMKLLTESCRDKASSALQYEGPVALQVSFQILGQVAGREMFSAPGVTASLAGLQKYIDEDKLKKLAPSMPETQLQKKP